MEITSFDDLLHAARAQPEPQRLLFVFAGVELPDDATPAQRERFAAGQGGALVPMMCVDKRPEEIASFQMPADDAGEAPEKRDKNHQGSGARVRHGETKPVSGEQGANSSD